MKKPIFLSSNFAKRFLNVFNDDASLSSWFHLLTTRSLKKWPLVRPSLLSSKNVSIGIDEKPLIILNTLMRSALFSRRAKEQGFPRWERFWIWDWRKSRNCLVVVESLHKRCDWRSLYNSFATMFWDWRLNRLDRFCLKGKLTFTA